MSAIEAVLKTNKAIDKFSTTAFDDLPTVKKVITRIQHSHGVASYQGAELADHETGVAYLKSHKRPVRRKACVLFERPCKGAAS